MRVTIRLWAAAAAIAVVVPAQARIPVRLPCYEDCWQEGLDRQGTAIVEQGKQEARALAEKEVRREEQGEKLDSSLEIEMLRVLLEERLEPADEDDVRALKDSGRVLADFSGTYPGREADKFLAKFPFLKMEGGSGGWGISSRLEPKTAAAHFRALRDELYRLVERAIFGAGVNARAEAVAFWACDTDVLLVPGASEPAGIFDEEQCHRLFS